MRRAALLAAAAAAASADPTVTATVDLTAKGTELQHYWKKCVGSGHMLLGTRADWRAHLKLARDELGMQGIRGHGLFDDDMSVVPNKRQPYEWYNTDQVFDYLVELGLRPVVELSFMPSALAKCGGVGKRCDYAFGDPGSYKGLIMPPDDFEDWYNLVKGLAEHLISRYGADEVRQWHFEVWNEMWGVPFPSPYMSLYNASALALKGVDKQLKVGGPATMQVLDVAGFINRTRAGGIPVDFVSTHFYPTDPQCQEKGTKLAPDCFADEVLGARRHAAAAGLPFFLTEYNNGLGGTSRDDSSAAAFVFRNVGLLDSLDLWSWWTFSDVFEEGWMRSAPFHNGYGMMTVHGTRKPVWRAFQLLNGAGSVRLPVTGYVSPADGSATVSVTATSGGAGAGPLGLQLFVANYHRIGDPARYECDPAQRQCVLNASGPYTDQALCDANCGKGPARGAPPAGGADPCPPRNVTITLRHAAGAAVQKAVARRIDAAHANPQAAWQAQGSPRYPTKEQLAALDAASQLVEEPITITALSATESALSFAMAPYSALHIAL